MIDKMIRCKTLNINDKIESICEWFYKCPPTGKTKHWKDGRSAKETAKHWVYTIPQPFKDILKTWGLKFNICSPEFVSTFDSNGGNGRNHDLLILAENKLKGPIVISIESKVDETFGGTISETIARAEKNQKENPNSKGLLRIEELRQTIFGKIDENQLDLRYQLLTAVAGTIAEAKKRNSKTSILLIQTFVSEEINKKKYKQNQDDLNVFINIFSNSDIKQIPENQLIGPFQIKSDTKYLATDIKLFFGKYNIEI